VPGDSVPADSVSADSGLATAPAPYVSCIAIAPVDVLAAPQTYPGAGDSE
jgi:hypothetical protein